MIRNLSGQKFGRLTVIKDTGRRSTSGNNVIWLCECDCGNFIEVRGCNLTTKRRPQKSCGCLIPESMRAIATRHGGNKDRLYRVWMGMRRRCNDVKVKDYPRYGGRGIMVCDDWQDYAVFREWALANGYDPNAEFQKCTLDRIDSNGNYEPANCRWVDIKTQENNRRNNKRIEYNGKVMNVSEWAEYVGMNADLLRDRLRRGWCFERAITEPVQHHTKRFQQTSV